MVSIRRAKPADRDLLIPLIREFCEIDQHPFELERIQGAIEPLLADDTHGQIWLVVTSDPPEDPDGYGVITWGYSLESGGRDALLDELYVRRRGAGVGTAALPAMIDAARTAGASRVFLETEAHNTRVRSFYAHLGFRTEESVWMSKDLTGQ
jgi:GNAT superfamily N-acetyltransferase